MAKVLRRIGIAVLCILLVLVLLVGGYVLYLVFAYYRIEDGAVLEISNNPAEPVQPGEEYTALTYNIGFGAYDHAFSFFMDTGTMADGTPVQGEHARAQSEEIARNNTEGSIGLARQTGADFLLFQEVDTDSDRSFHINQAEEIEGAFPGYGSVFALNFHSAFLPYPFTEPHGAVQSGLLTLSNRQMDEAVRRSYPVDESFPTKFFDLDRCFAVVRLPAADGRELVLINNHMSAYDEGGTVRAAQMEMLMGVLAEEYAKGNWVVAGGDFNHAFYETIDSFPSGQQKPGWVYPFDHEALPDGFTLVRASNIDSVPSLRSTDIPYQEGVSYRSVVDGFIVSANVTCTAETLDANFEYSDHNPVLLRFTLG